VNWPPGGRISRLLRAARVGARRSSSYHHGVSFVGYAAAALGGVALGWLVFYLVNRRSKPLPAPETSGRPALEQEVLRLSTTGYLVVNRVGRHLLSNDRATELGIMRGGIVDQEILDAAARAGVSGETIDVELRPVSPSASLSAPRTAPSAVLAVVRPIGDGRILVAATDESAAQRMEAARRDFVANVSHELKTPVAAMGLLAEATVDAADDPDAVRRFAGKLQAEAVRLGALVNELIALSRLQGAEPLPDLAVVEVDAVVDETISRVSTAAENAGITLTSDARSGLLVRGDRSLLVTALTNLVDNAINYSATGTQVSISRSVRDDQIQISVTDRGVGIAPEYAERVFERFFRIDPARSRATGGTGLGLAIVKHVAANHGGTATVWSRPGTGSTFTLRIPAVSSPPGSAKVAAAEQSAPAPMSQPSTPAAVQRGVS
jgi:two-component system sensor histidine kinase SenX3